jgi:hypothetical protein
MIEDIKSGGGDVSGLIERSSISYDVPEGVTAIGSYAFAEMNSLQAVTIPDSVRKIGMSAFFSCEALERIILPNAVNDIDYSAFDSCSGLIVAGLGGASKIKELAFAFCSSLKKIIISKSTTEIQYKAFYDCRSLTDVYYRGNATEWAAITIGNGNTKLTSATIHYNYTGDGSEL